jgi:hypothetical protein
MFTRKALATIVVGLSMTATPAYGGEWKGTTSPGNEQRTPIHDQFYDSEKGPSICAFSGLNDEYYLDGDEEATRTQSYGTLVADGNADPHAFNPGVACNMGE